MNGPLRQAEEPSEIGWLRVYKCIGSESSRGVGSPLFFDVCRRRALLLFASSVHPVQSSSTTILPSPWASLLLPSWGLSPKGAKSIKLELFCPCLVASDCFYSDGENQTSPSVRSQSVQGDLALLKLKAPVEIPAVHLISEEDFLKEVPKKSTG